MPSSTPQHQHVTRSPGTIPLSERQQMALLSRMTEEQKQHHSHVSVNKHGETPLHIAAKQGSEDEVQELLSKGVDPNCPDAAGWTPLHEACIRGRYNVAKTLIMAGADANAKGYQGFTPLHDAAANGHAELINLLLEFGADVTQRNHKGQAPVDVAPEPIKAIFNNRADKTSSEASSSGASHSSVSTRNSLMRRLPSHSKGSDSSASSSTGLASTPPSSPSTSSSKLAQSASISSSSSSPRVTLRLSQQQLKSARISNEETGVLGSKKCKVNLAASSGAYSSSYSSSECLDGGGTDGLHSSKVKMENMEEILLKENTSAIETNSSQDESKDPLADTESVISPSHGDKTGADGGESGGDKEAGLKRGADNSSDEESKKKRRKEEAAPKGKASGQTEAGSPKASAPGANESDLDDGTHLNKGVDSPPCVGPKVPPLKIVLPSAATTESDLSAGGSGRSSKSGVTRHAALPYVVASDIGGDLSGSAPPSPGTTSDSNMLGGDADKPGAIKQEIKQEPLTEEQRTTQRILRSSHSRGSSSSSPAAQDASPSTLPVHTPPSSAVPSPGPPEITIKSEPLSCATGINSTNASSTVNTSTSAVDEKPVLPQVTPSEDPSPAESQHTLSSSVELHPRKRKLKHARADSSWNSVTSSGNGACATSVSSTTSAPAGSGGTSGVATTTGGGGTVVEVKEEPVGSAPATTADQPFTNCYQLYLNIRKQIDLRRRGLFPVKPITPSKFARYLMVTCDYVLADTNASRHQVPKYEAPAHLPPVLKDLFTVQEQERYRLRMQHVVEKEKFALGVEQEILRVHCHAARELANQPLPYSACTILKDEEVYNLIGPETDDKDSLEHRRDKRTDRYRYNGRLFIKWLRDIDDKWDKIKKRMIIRQTNEAESLHAVQQMDWQWKVREFSLEVPASPQGEDYVPLVSIVDDLQSTDELAS